MNIPKWDAELKAGQMGLCSVTVGFLSLHGIKQVFKTTHISVYVCKERDLSYGLWTNTSESSDGPERDGGRHYIIIKM